MNEEEIVFHQIGIIHSPHTNLAEIPIQPVFARGIRGTVTVDPAYADGLKDLDGVSHIHLLYCFHKAGDTKLTVTPFLDDTERGVFATRAFCRPNRLGLSLVTLRSIEGNVLHIEDVDILDGTPLLDIKPYIRRFDVRDTVRSGWEERIDDDIAQIRGRRNYDT